MLSKLSRNLGTRINGSSGSQIRNYQSVINMTLTNSLPKTIPRQRKIRVKERRRMTLGRGETSTKSLGTTPMNVT
jgi:hypothetical protein